MSAITIIDAEARRAQDQVLDVREDFEVAEGMTTWQRAGLPTV